CCTKPLGSFVSPPRVAVVQRYAGLLISVTTVRSWGRELLQWCLNYLSMHRREGLQCWLRYGVPAGEVCWHAQAISPCCLRGHIRYSIRLSPKLLCVPRMLAWPICRAVGSRSMTPWSWHV